MKCYLHIRLALAIFLYVTIPKIQFTLARLIMIKVLIERFIADTLEANYEDTAKEILQRAIRSDGFMSGESLKDTQNPLHRFIICNWRSVVDWQRWEMSSERRELMAKLNLMLERDEKTTVLEMP